jgi:hypothetical protein
MVRVEPALRASSLWVARELLSAPPNSSRVALEMARETNGDS